MTNLPAIIQETGVSLQEYQVLKDAIFPGASDDGLALAVKYCKARGLDIMKKPVHIIKVWNSSLGREVEGLWPSINETRTTASRTGEYAGSSEPEYGEDVTKDFNFYDAKTRQTVARSLTFPKWCKVTVHRIIKGVKCDFTSKVFWLEEYASTKTGAPNSMWENRPYGQIAKVAEASALRKGFPEEIGGLPTKEEVEGDIAPIPEMKDVTPNKIEKIVEEAKQEVIEPDVEFVELSGEIYLNSLRGGCETIFRAMKELDADDRKALYTLNMGHIEAYSKQNSKFSKAIKVLLDAA